MKVAIVGYGLEGQASYDYWQSMGHQVTIVDQSRDISVPEGAATILGDSALDQLHGFDLVVRTPQIRPDAIVTDGTRWSATNEFLAHCPAPIIGVTGTKGKGTTVTLIADMLRRAGTTTHVVGNIGVPALSVLDQITKEDIVVYEMSSFQLWDAEKSPELAVVLMIVEDHMDVHTSLDEYVEAKAQIVRHMTGDQYVIHHPDNILTQRAVSKTAAKKQRYMSPEGARIEGDSIVIQDTTICRVSDVRLLGAHNLENVCAAITAAWHYTRDTDAIAATIKTCKGLPHRLRPVAQHERWVYVDDSQSTGPDSTLAALASFEGQSIALILGGSDKGVDMSGLVSYLCQTPTVSVVLIGQSSRELHEALADCGDRVRVLGSDVSMRDIVGAATDALPSGGIVLLSPAHASFDMFESYVDRGEQFGRIARSL